MKQPKVLPFFLLTGDVGALRLLYRRGFARALYDLCITVF